MDYKELIEQLRNVFQKGGYELEHSVCESAATAIETLLAEREAAIKYIPHNCQTCKWWHRDCGCTAPDDMGQCLDLREIWQWRGPTPPDRERAER